LFGHPAALSGVQRFVYGLTVRQICPDGHCAFEALQRQRPLVLAGLGVQPEVTETDSQLRPGSHDRPQPPQWPSFEEMFTH
jgi:hypothetical protein